MGQYKDRSQAGKVLADLVIREIGADPSSLVLALPRGGVPVAVEVAKALNAELDVIVVRKLGMPFDPEFAFGAISVNGAKYINEQLVAGADLARDTVNEIIGQETAELHRRERVYRGECPPLNASDRTVIVVDDGIATGATMKAAIAAIRSMKPTKIVLAVPVAPAIATIEFKDMVDKFVCPFWPESLEGVGQWYDDFSQVEDEEVVDLLRWEPTTDSS